MNLYAVRTGTPVTAAEAAAWFTDDDQTIGYALGAQTAQWLRTGAGTPADAYEMVLFDGRRELRWLHTRDGRGTAVALGEDRSRLPAGVDVTAHPLPRRGDAQRRLLAGVAQAHPTPGWTTLHSSRYADAVLPVVAAPGELLAVETVEYLSEDEHGNVDVADTLTVGIVTVARSEA